MERQRANRKLLPDAFSDVSVIKCSHYRLIGTSNSAYQYVRYGTYISYYQISIFRNQSATGS